MDYLFPNISPVAESELNEKVKEISEKLIPITSFLAQLLPLDEVDEVFKERIASFKLMVKREYNGVWGDLNIKFSAFQDSVYFERISDCMREFEFDELFAVRIA